MAQLDIHARVPTRVERGLLALKALRYPSEQSFGGEAMNPNGLGMVFAGSADEREAMQEYADGSDRPCASPENLAVVGPGSAVDTAYQTLRQVLPRASFPLSTEKSQTSF